MSTVNVNITNGPSIDVKWFSGMNTQQALEGAYNQQNLKEQFNFALQYYGSSLGYLVIMMDNLYEQNSPLIYYWEFYINGVASKTGIDNTILKEGDKVKFAYERYNTNHETTTVGVKHKSSIRD